MGICLLLYFLLQFIAHQPLQRLHFAEAIQHMIRPGSSGSGEKHRQDLCNISWGTNSVAQAHVVPQAPSTLHIVPGPKPALEGGQGSKCFRPKKGVPTFGTQCKYNFFNRVQLSKRPNFYQLIKQKHKHKLFNYIETESIFIFYTFDGDKSTFGFG